MMSLKTAVLSAGAVALSTSAVQVALVAHLKRRGLMTDQEHQEIYEQALLLLEQGQAGEDDGPFAVARELIEMHLRPESKL